ncbi:hypothetical protein RCL_jg1216.t1 [Rhizophagus clarus]|uniref:Protein kinase domain-containing protein n=1 Tax=Rhizophagus clarus TaxID=94130 RepID=A0A8H3LF13_9GLOM|nr:hypothetical protein RCL_jg1216.t1 [Rhizophagus clarus]
MKLKIDSSSRIIFEWIPYNRLNGIFEKKRAIQQHGRMVHYIIIKMNISETLIDIADGLKEIHQKNIKNQCYIDLMEKMLEFKSRLLLSKRSLVLKLSEAKIANKKAPEVERQNTANIYCLNQFNLAEIEVLMAQYLLINLYCNIYIDIDYIMNQENIDTNMPCFLINMWTRIEI